MKTLLIAALLFLSFGTFAQGKAKIDKKDGIVSVNGVPYFKHEVTTTVLGVKISALSGEKLFFLRQESLGGQLFWSLIREGDREVKCELHDAYAKTVAKLFLEYTLLDENGKIIEANFDKMAADVGMTYTANQYPR